MDICINSINPTGCGHYDVTVSVEGTPVVLHVHENELLEPFTELERETFVRLSLRRLRQIKNVTLSQIVNHVTHGDEATNVKQYDLIGAGSVVTKTSIGSTYVDILPGLNGQRNLVDFTGCTEARILLNANLITTGPFGFRIVRDTDSAVIYENASVSVTGERELDTNWIPLPVSAAGLILVRLQGRSATVTDSPVFRRCLFVVR